MYAAAAGGFSVLGVWMSEYHAEESTARVRRVARAS
jgi:hypothetical protein